jgi:hypothetical protein
VRRGTRPTLAPGLDPDRMKMRMFLGSYFAGAFCSEFWWATSQIVTAPIEKKNSISSTVLGLEGRRERFVLFFFCEGESRRMVCELASKFLLSSRVLISSQ